MDDSVEANFRPNSEQTPLARIQFRSPCSRYSALLLIRAFLNGQRYKTEYRIQVIRSKVKGGKAEHRTQNRGARRGRKLENKSLSAIRCTPNALSPA